MKTVVMFVLGAILAGGLVYSLMRTGKPVETAQVTSAVQPAQTPAAPVEPAAETAPEKPSPAPPARVQEQEPVAKASSRPARTKRPSARAAKTAEPQFTAQSSTPSSNESITIKAPAAPPPYVPEAAPAPPAPATPIVEEKKPEPPRVAKTVTIPAGTLLTVRVDEELSTETVQSGDSFRATLDQPVVIDGFVIAERGSRVEGRVVESDAGGRVRGVSSMTLELIRLNTSDGQRVKLQTETFAKRGEQSRKKDIAKVGAAAGLGAAIGAIAGGGKGAAIGAAIGGAAGTGGVMATRGGPAEIPAETRVSFRLRDAITITEKL